MGPVLARGAVLPQGQMTGMSQNTMTRRWKWAQATEEEFRNLTGACDHVFGKAKVQLKLMEAAGNIQSKVNSDSVFPVNGCKRNMLTSC